MKEVESGTAAFGKFFTALNKFDGSEIGIKKLAESFNGLSLESAKAILGVSGLTEVQIKCILESAGLSTELATTTAAEIAAGNAATGAAGGFAAFATSVKTAATGLLTFLTTNPVGWAIMAVGAITAVSAGINAYNKHIQELVDNAKEAASAWTESNSSLESYAERVNELRTTLDSGTLSEEEAYQAKSELLEIQKSLSESYGDQISGIDLVNGSLERQLDLINQLSIADANELLNENIKGIEKAEKEMTKERTLSLGQITLDPKSADSKVLDDILEKYSDYLSTVDIGDGVTQTVYFTGDATEADEVLNNLMTDLRNASSEFEYSPILDGFIDGTSKQLENVNEILGEYQDLYKQSQQAKLVADVKLYGEGENAKTAVEWLNDYSTAVEEYNDALASGDSSAIAEAANNFNSVDAAIQSLLAGTGMSAYADMFQDIKNQLNEATIAQNAFIDAITGSGTIDGKNYAAFADNLKELGLTDLDFEYAVNTDGLQKGEGAINALIIAAKNAHVINGSTAEDIQILIDLLVEAGIISGTTTEAVENASAAFKDFATYQENVSSALESSKSATGLTTDEVTNLTDAYKDLESFDASKLFEETANGIHLNKEELSRLNEELESNELQKYADEINI